MTTTELHAHVAAMYENRKLRPDMNHRRIALLVVGTLNIAAAPWMSAQSLAPPLLKGTTCVKADIQPTSVSVGDVTADGSPDLVVTSDQSATVSVYPGDGLGHFGTPTAYPTGADLTPLALYPRASVLADFDGDTALDIAVANAYGRNVAILLNDGFGAFSDAVEYDVGSGFDALPSALAAGDLDGDGNIDLVVADAITTKVIILWGQGLGTFGAPERLTFGDDVTSVALGDFDSNGALDIAATSFGSAEVVVRRNLGAGAFASPVKYSVGTGPNTVVARDLNNDGIVDLAVSNSGSASISVLAGKSTGLFEPAIHYPLPVGAWGLVDGDVNSDGIVDLVVRLSDSPDVAILLGLETGGFQTPEMHGFASAVMSVTGMVLADLNTDGRLDLVGAVHSDRTAAILWGSVDGFADVPGSWSVGDGPESVAMGDISGDGIPDLVVANSASQSLSVLIADGDGDFLTPSTYPTGLYPRSVVLADFDSDGMLDVVVADYGSTGVSLYLNQGSGQLGSTEQYWTGTHPWAVASGDLDGDGLVDLVVSVLDADAIAVLRGLGAGTFGPAMQHSVGGLTPRDVALNDVNGDGFLDVIVGMGNLAGGLAVSLGSAGGVLGPFVTYPALPSVSGLSIADVDQDGHLDAIVASDYDDRVSVLHGDGSGTFVASAPFGVGVGPRSVVVSDLNGDGLSDIAAGCVISDVVSVLLGKGAGEFGEATHVGVPNGVDGLALGDVDGDGDADFVVANRFEGTVSTLLNSYGDSAGAWTNLQSGLSGVSGVPLLKGSGSLSVGSSGSLALSSAIPNAPAILLVSNLGTTIAFKCGTVVPFPMLLQLVTMSDAVGRIEFAWLDWPSGLSGFEIYMQYAILDDAAACGVSLSNAVKADVP